MLFLLSKSKGSKYLNKFKSTFFVVQPFSLLLRLQSSFLLSVSGVFIIKYMFLTFISEYQSVCGSALDLYSL